MNMSVALSRSKQCWEDMAELDPCWAILSDPSKKFGKWDIDAFYVTGEHEVSRLMTSVAELGYPRGRHLALDFGCGLGRLTRSLSRHFDKCLGIDISEEMIRRARELNVAHCRCEFIVNTDDSLAQFEDNYFDFIYTSIVLQHVPTRAAIKLYVTEFTRILKPGGALVMQIPNSIPLRRRLQARPRLYGLLRWLGLNEAFLYRRLSLTPIRMNFVREQEMLLLLRQLGVVMLRVQPDSMAGPGIESRSYFVTKAV